MTDELIKVIYGTLITTGLAANAHFIKGLWESIADVKSFAVSVDKRQAVITAEVSHLTARVTGAEKDIRAQRDTVHDLRNELGNRIQVLELKLDKDV